MRVTPDRPMLAKVPAVLAIFWAVKLLTTGMGEACADWLGSISVPLAAGVGLLGIVIGLALQLRRKEYHAPTYWFAVSMVAVFGTMVADGPHVVLGIPYPVMTALYFVAVLAILAIWHRVEGTLSIHSITTTRRELFYWATVLATFALGTAAGDLTANTFNLGYFPSALLFGVLILVPLIAWRFLGLSSVAAFWSAYVLTRPLGASIADWLGKPHDKGNGLDFGDGPVTLVLVVIIVAAVAYLARTRVDIQDPADVR